MAEEKDDWLDDLEGPDDKAPDLGQSDLDALLSDHDEAGPSPGEAELGQADIDALLSGDDFAAPSPQDTGAATGDLSQSDIETLLASPGKSAQDQPFSDPDQDEIDKLFSEPDTDDSAESKPFPAEDLDFGDAFDTVESPPSQSPLPPDFGQQEFKLEADIPDIPDFPNAGAGGGGPKSFLDEETVAIPVEQATVAASAGALAGAAAASGQGLPGKLRALLANRKILLAAGGVVAVLVLLAAGLFLFKGGKKTPLPEGTPQVPAEVAHEKAPAPEQPPPAEGHGEAAHPAPAEEGQTPPPPAPAAAPAAPEHGAPALPPGAPMLADLTLVMPAGSSELPITLEGKDPAHQPLEYEFQSMPQHGQISGHAPHLVYSARADFAGQDSFTIRASNGKQFSPTAKITITREMPVGIVEPPAPISAVAVAPADITPSPAAPPQATAPALPANAAQGKAEGIAARDVSYTISTNLLIPWEKVWGKVNARPYGPEVQVEILTPPKHGTLAALNGRQSAYKPGPSFSGKDSLQYRFVAGDLKSEPKTVTISVKRKSKNKAPELQIEPYSPIYNAGDMVFLNASQTKDEARETVKFRWEQTSGAPVVIKPLNSEGSHIGFVAPATFNTVANPGVGLKVTATDAQGWSVSREIYVKTQSRRNTAIWR